MLRCAGFIGLVLFISEEAGLLGAVVDMGLNDVTEAELIHLVHMVHIVRLLVFAL